MSESRHPSVPGQDCQTAGLVCKPTHLLRVRDCYPSWGHIPFGESAESNELSPQEEVGPVCLAFRSRERIPGGPESGSRSLEWSHMSGSKSGSPRLVFIPLELELGWCEGLQKWKECSGRVGASVSCGSWSSLGAPQDRAAARVAGIAKENFLPVFTTLQAGLLCGSAQTQSSTQRGLFMGFPVDPSCSVRAGNAGLLGRGWAGGDQQPRPRCVFSLRSLSCDRLAPCSRERQEDSILPSLSTEIFVSL